jgi:c-di-GMP-binding flagellar brake protein YcgR
MKNVAVEVNELLQISFPDQSSSRSFSSRVEDVEQDYINIAWPTDNGLRVPVRIDERLFVSFTREDAAYGFLAKVQRTQTEPVPVLVMEPIAAVERTQRRENVRVRVRLPVELIGSVEPADSESSHSSVVLLIKGNTFDFSGGGLGLLHHQLVPLGSVLECRFSLPGNSEPFKIPVKVVRCAQELDAQRNRIFRVGLMFFGISERTRSRIIRYVFGIQNSVVRD